MFDYLPLSSRTIRRLKFERTLERLLFAAIGFWLGGLCAIAIAALRP